MSTMIKIEKVLTLPSTLDLNTIYFVKNDTTNELKIVCTNNVGTIAYETNDQTTIRTIMNEEIGDLNTLLTTNKTTLTNAINELAAQLISVEGPLTVNQFESHDYVITNYDSGTTYNINVQNATYVVNNNTITITFTTAGNCQLTINNRNINIIVTASFVNAPVILSPTNAAINVSTTVTVTADDFSYQGIEQTIVEDNWQVATDSNFTNIVYGVSGIGLNPTTLNLPTLKTSQRYYVRTRRGGSVTGLSAWSNTVYFNTVEINWLSVYTTLANLEEIVYNSVAVDSSFNGYVVGGDNYNQALITKWDSNGALTWQKLIGGTNEEIFNRICVDASNNLYAVGSEKSTSGASNYSRAYITKWNSSGSLIWQKSIGDNGPDNFRSVGVDSSGNVYACGQESSSGGIKAFITKWDTNGNLIWQKSFSYGMACVFIGMKITANDDIYVTGTIYNGGYQGILAKLNTSGTIVWSSMITGYNDCRFYGIDTDTSGNIFTVGERYTQNGVVAKWTSSGALLELKADASFFTTSIFTDISINYNNKLYISGQYNAAQGRQGFRHYATTSLGDFQSYIFSTDNETFFTGITSKDNDSFMVGGEYKTSGVIKGVYARWDDNIPQGALVESNLSGFSIVNQNKTFISTTASYTALSLTTSTPTLTVNTPTFSVTTPTFSYYLNNF